MKISKSNIVKNDFGVTIDLNDLTCIVFINPNSKYNVIMRDGYDTSMIILRGESSIELDGGAEIDFSPNNIYTFNNEQCALITRSTPAVIVLSRVSNAT